MAVVKINALEVPEGMEPMIEERFAARVGEVEKMPGFLAFELLRPTGGETRYFVYTRWESDEAFRAWVESESFSRGHAEAGGPPGHKPASKGAGLLEFDVVIEAGPAS